MSENEKIEFRVFLIGDENCGKKTIINRFKNLRCSETIIIKEKKHNKEKLKEFEARNNKKMLALPDLIYSKINSNLNLYTNRDKEKDKERQNQNQKLKQKPNNFIKENILNINNNKNKTPLININFLKNKLDNLTNFTKIFNLPKFYFEMNFFICPYAETIDFNDKVNEEEDCETMHRMRLDKFKRFLKTEINKPNENPKGNSISPELSSSSKKIKYLFMFVYDITNKQSLNRLKVYYEEIDKIFFIENQNKIFFKVLIGNKTDVKALYPFNENDRNFLMNFILEKKIKHFEISGKLNFNFEKFFEKMFYEVIINEGGFEVFISDYFKTKFNNILYSTTTFSKEKRDKFKFNYNDNNNDNDNDNVNNNYNNNRWLGPGRYENNQYELNGEKDKRK